MDRDEAVVLKGKIDRMKDALGRALTAARHQDAIRSWPWVGRLIHWIFVSWRCPACRYWKGK